MASLGYIMRYCLEIKQTNKNNMSKIVHTFANMGRGALKNDIFLGEHQASLEPNLPGKVAWMLLVLL